MGGNVNSVVNLQVSKLKDLHYPLDKFGGTLMHEISHVEQRQFSRNAKGPKAAGLTEPELLRAKHLDLSLQESTSALEQLDRGSSRLSRFQTEVETLWSAPSAIPNKLLSYESDKNRQALMNLFGVDSLPSEIRTWARD